MVAVLGTVFAAGVLALFGWGSWVTTNVLETRALREDAMENLRSTVKKVGELEDTIIRINCAINEELER